MSNHGFINAVKEVYSNLPTPDYKSLVTDSIRVKAVEYQQTIMLNGLATGLKLPVDELSKIIKTEHFKNENFLQIINLYKKSKTSFPELSPEDLVNIQHDCQYEAISNGAPFKEIIKIQTCHELQNFAGSTFSEEI
jgi:hypothetical protein